MNPSVASSRCLRVLALQIGFCAALLIPGWQSGVQGQVPNLEQALGLGTTTNSESSSTEQPEAATQTQPQTKPKINPLYDSPRKTVFTFVAAMQDNLGGSDEVWKRATDAIDFSSMPDIDDVKKRRLAEDLYGVLMHIERPFDIEVFLDKAQVEYLNRDRQYYFPNRIDLEQAALLERMSEPPQGSIALEKQLDGTWKFDNATAEDISKLWNQIQVTLGIDGDVLVTRSDHIEWYLSNVLRVPKSMVKGQWLGIEYWKWMGMLFVIIVGLVLDQTVRFTLRMFVLRSLRKRDEEIDHEAIRKSVRPFGMLTAAILWLATLAVINLEGMAVMIIEGGLQVFIVFAGLLSIWRLIDLFTAYLAAKASNTLTRLDDVLVPLIRKSLKIFAGIMGVLYAADALSIPIAPLLASVGVGAVAFSFAAKDTVENFFGSLAVLFDRPFDIGDWVVANDVEGTVEEVGFRSTRIRTFYNSQVTMPNANLVRAVVDNYGRRKYRRWREEIGVQYDTPPDKLIAFTEGIRELVRSHPYTRKDYFQVRLNSFGDSSFNILVYTFVQVDDWSMELRERERLMLDIIRLADQLGVEFAFPTRTVHLFTENHDDYKTRFQAPARNTERRAEIAGIRAAQQLVEQQRWRSEKPGPVEFPEGPVTVDDEGNIDAAEITEDTKPSQLVSEIPEEPATPAQTQPPEPPESPEPPPPLPSAQSSDASTSKDKHDDEDDMKSTIRRS